MHKRISSLIGFRKCYNCIHTLMINSYLIYTYCYPCLSMYKLLFPTKMLASELDTNASLVGQLIPVTRRMVWLANWLVIMLFLCDSVFIIIIFLIVLVVNISYFEYLYFFVIFISIIFLVV